MKQTVPVDRRMWSLMLLIPLAIGCSTSDDERLARYASDATQRQKEQNESIAKLSERIVDERENLTEAARDLVAPDAEARREMIEVQVALNSDLHTERANIDRQREDMEQERRDLATARVREPVVAESIKVTGILIACLCPLVLAAYLLRQLRTNTANDQAVANFLACELVADKPKLLPITVRPVPQRHHFTALNTGVSCPA